MSLDTGTGPTFTLRIHYKMEDSIYGDTRSKLLGKFYILAYLLLFCLLLVSLLWLHWCCWFFPLQFGSGDVDFVLDAAVSVALLHSLTDRIDEIVFDPEGFVQLVLSHHLAQLLQHQAPVGIARPLTLRQDDQTLRWLRERLCWRTRRMVGGSRMNWSIY